MSPTLKNHQTIIVNKLGKIKRFSIIAFNANKVDPGSPKDRIYVKRIIGIPGDYIDYKSNGDLYINKKKVKQSFVSLKNKNKGTLNPKISNIQLKGFTVQSIYKLNNLGKSIKRVPRNQYFVMGDNRSISFDSRFFGCVKKSDILGTIN